MNWKFDPRCDEGIFLGHSNKSNTNRCYNKRLLRIVKSTNVKVDEQNRSQRRIYEQESTVEMVLTEPVTPIQKQNVEPVTPAVPENSTITKD